MAGASFERIRQIAHDFQHSWYFRLWAVVWLVCALTVFSGLIILSKYAEKNNKYQDVEQWVENMSSINFPHVHFHLDPRGNEVFVSSVCTDSNGNNIPQVACDFHHGGSPAQNICVAFVSENVVASQHPNYPNQGGMFFCTLQTAGVGYNGNMMNFGVEGPRVFEWNGAAYQGLTFFPNDMTWMMLKKTYFQRERHGDIVEIWDSQVMYHSSLHQNWNFYNVSVVMGDFFVDHLTQRDEFTGWMTVGSIGGVAFFMTVLHTIVMIIIGCLFTNNSTFLNGKEGN